jgi:hypothetical protein
MLIKIQSQKKMRLLCMIRSHIILLVFVSIAASCFSITNSFEKEKPEEIKILFIGNSITYYNQMPAIFKTMAFASGKNIYVGKWVHPGAMLADFAKSPVAEQSIQQKKWDYVILQDGDYSIIESSEHKRLAQSVNYLKDLILKNNPNTKILFQLLYSLKDGIKSDKLNYNYETFTEKIVDGTRQFAKKYALNIVPVGSAWNEVIENNPEINLYEADKMHPAYAGSFLIACVYYSTIFQETCVDNPFNGSLSVEEATVLKKAASKIVLNNNNLN